MSNPRHPGSTSPSARPLVVWFVLLALVAVLVPQGTSLAQESSQDLARDLGASRGETEALRSELGDLRSDIEVAEEELAAVGARLSDARGRLQAAEGQVALGEQALDDARGEQERARRAHEGAQRRLEATEQRLLEEEAVLTDQIVQTFKYGTVGATGGAMALEILRRAEDPNEFAVAMKQLQTVVDVQDSTVQTVFGLREDRADQADAAARARARAAQTAAAAADTLRVLEELREEAAGIAVEVEQQEQSQATLLGNLRATESETAALLERARARQATLERAYQEQRARELAAAAAAAAAAGGGGGRLGLPGAGGGPPLEGMVCPVVGAVAGRDYSNDWGYPRSGGRTHQGNDMFAARGTSVVAVHDGVVVRWNPPSAPTALGGITVTYRTADNSEWYNAHLDTVAAGIQPGASVSRGQVIGTVGNSGNARTTPPHLHLGRRYAGSWVNPWPSTAPVC